MHLPHLQIETKEQERLAAELADFVRREFPDDVVRHEVFWWRGALDAFWQWGLALSGNARPDGVCRGRNADVRVAGVLKWPHDPSILISWFLELELIERLEEGLRVRGVAKRYGNAWDKQAAEAERKRQWREDMARKRSESKKNQPTKPVRRTSGGRDADATRTSRLKTQTQTQTQTQTHIDPDPDPPPPAAPPRLVVVGNEKAIERLKPAHRDRWEHVQRVRLACGLLAETTPPAGFEEFCAELDETGVDEARFGHVLALYTRDKHFADRRWPTAVLIQPGVWRQRLPVPPREAAR